MATQPAKVNRALAKAGLKVEIVKGYGYYYFAGLPGTCYVGDEIRSLYQCHLHQTNVSSDGKYKQTRRAFAKLKWVAWGVDWTQR